MRNPLAFPWLLPALLAAVLAAPPPVSAAWNPAGEVVPVPVYQRVATACTDGSGGLLTFWTANSAEHPGTLTGVYAHRRLADGTSAPGWPAEGRLLGSVERLVPLAEELAVLEDGTGGAFLFFREYTSSSNPQLVSHRLFRMSADGSLDPAWPDSGLALGRRTFGGKPLLVGDGAGGVFAAWLDHVEARLDLFLEPYPGYVVHGLSELRLTRVSGSGEPAPGWSTEGLLVRGVAPESLYAEFVRAPIAASDGAGGVLLAWADSSGGDDLMRAWRIGANGAAAGGWPRDGVVLSTSPVWSCSGWLADGSGGVFAAWTEAVPGFGAARLVRLDGSGQVASGWPAGGLDPANGAGDYHRMGGIISDGTGGVYAQVQGITPGSAAFVRLVRRDGAAGLPPGWTADGLSFAGGPAFLEQVVTPVPDLGGGVRAVWGMGGDPAVHDVRVGPDGAVRPGWSSTSPRITPLRANALLEAWVADSLGALYVLAHWNYGDPIETRAFQISTREQALAAVPTTPSARIALTAGPNPVTATCAISFAAPGTERVTLDVLDAGGRCIRSLATSQAGGIHRATWDGRTESGAAAPAGLYFVVARNGASRESRRIALVR